MKKGKQWVSKTSRKMAVDSPKDNRKIKAAALSRRPADDVMDVGLNSVMSSGGYKKTILGFDARRFMRTSSGKRKGEGGLVAGAGQPLHVYMTKYHDGNNKNNASHQFEVTYDTDRDRDAVADLIQRMYGKESTTGESKPTDVKIGKKASGEDGVKSAARKKKKKIKKKSHDIVESSKKSGDSLNVGSFNSKPSNGEKDLILESSRDGDRETKQAKTLKVADIKTLPIDRRSVGSDSGELRPTRKHQKRVSESEAPRVQRPRYEDTRKTTSEDSLSHRFFVRKDAGSTKMPNSKEPVADVPKRRTEKKNATSWTEMKEKPEVYATDIQKRLELYTTQYVAGSLKKQRNNKDDGEVSEKVLNESIKKTGKQKQPANSSDVNQPSLVISKTSSTKTVLVTELMADLKSPDLNNAEKNRVKLVTETSEKSRLEPNLTITHDDLSPKVKCPPDAGKPEKRNCGPCLKPQTKPKPKAKTNNELKTMRTARPASNVPKSSIYPPLLDTEMWSKILINRMDQVKQAAGIPTEKPATDINKVVDDVLEMSQIRAKEEVVRTNVDKQSTVSKPPSRIEERLETESEVIEIKSPKVLSKRDKQLIDEIKKQWSDKFKTKFSQIMKNRANKPSGQKTLPTDCGSDTEVFRTAVNSVKPSPSPPRHPGCGGKEAADCSDINDVIYIGPSSNPIKPVTQSDLTYWELINCRSDVTTPSCTTFTNSNVRSEDLDKTQTVREKESLQRERESSQKMEFLRDMAKTYTRSETIHSAKPRKKLSAKPRKELSAKPRKELSAKLKKNSQKKADFDPNAKGDYNPSLKKMEREKREKQKISNYLRNLPTLRGVSGGNSLAGMMEMKLIPVEEETKMKVGDICICLCCLH